MSSLFYNQHWFELLRQLHQPLFDSQWPSMLQFRRQWVRDSKTDCNSFLADFSVETFTRRRSRLQIYGNGFFLNFNLDRTSANRTGFSAFGNFVAAIFANNFRLFLHNMSAMDAFFSLVRNFLSAFRTMNQCHNVFLLYPKIRGRIYRNPPL